MSLTAIGKEKHMGPTQQTETTTIYLTYNDPAVTVTRNPPGEFKVGEVLEFRSGDPSEFVKVVLHPPSAYEPNAYDETDPNKQPVRVVNAEKGAVWCYFRKKHGPRKSDPPAWSERYGFESDPGT
jgi:hypothetical protein